MIFSAWLDAEKGRTKATAEHFAISKGAISQWRDGVPRERMRALRAFIGKAVSYEEMLPASKLAATPKAVSSLNNN